MGLFARSLLAFGLLATSGFSAWADHMTGRYSGTGQAAGTNLEIQQSGRMLRGQLSGATQGTLTGQSDGGDNASGTVDVTGVGQLQFQSQWSRTGLTLRIQGASGSAEYVFTPAGAGIPQTPGPQTPGFPQTPGPQTPGFPQPPGPQTPGFPEPPNPPPLQPPVQPPALPPEASAAEYYIVEGGQQIGPLSLQQVQQRLAAGAASGSDLVWKPGLPDWTRIDSLPELSVPQREGPPPLPPGLNVPPSDTRTDNPDGGVLKPEASAPTEEQLKLSAIVFGSTVGVLAHELGHALIGEFQIPSTGAEEDTADEFSALIMASMVEESSSAGMPANKLQLLTDMVAYSTLLWFHDAQKSAQTGQRPPWYDEHSSSETRFRNTLCMIYGSAPDRFKFLADRVGLPDRERGRCETDHAKRYRAWETITAPFARNRGGEYPGQLPADMPGAEVKVVYEPSKSTFGQSLQTEFRKLGLFEALADGLEDLLVWKRDFQIVFADCGAANAFYDPSNARIVMCWEGVEHFFWIVAEPEGIQRTAAN